MFDMEELSSVTEKVYYLLQLLPKTGRTRVPKSESKMARQISGKFPVVIGREFTPHLASTIFNLLDKQELMKSRLVSSVWKEVVDSRTNLWTDPELYGKAAKEGNLNLCQMIIENVDNKNPSFRKLGPHSWSCYVTP